MITIAEYLLTRLDQLGVKHMFGVPGELNLPFCDKIEDLKKIAWIGGCNELNSAYAADGYARVKRSLGVCLTIFGVGELSALNGIAGAVSEEVPMLHIVGVPSTAQQKEKTLVDHTLGDARFDPFMAASQQITSIWTILTKKDAASKIDRLLIECISKSRPAYLALPTDLAGVNISSESLQYPLSRHVSQNDPAAEQFVVNRITSLFAKALSQTGSSDVVVLVDLGAIRYDVVQEVKDLLQVTGFPVYATPCGKSIISETYDRYGGIYWGSELSSHEVKQKVEEANLVLLIGPFPGDFNTGNYNYDIPTECMIELYPDHTKIQDAVFPGVGMKQLLPKLGAQLQRFHGTASQIPVPKFDNVVPQDGSSVITHDWLWPRVGQFFKPNDVILAETGTAQFAIVDVRLPSGSDLLSQMRWASIGWAVGAALGACLAIKEGAPRRTVVFVGDGSLQMTVQELSSLIRTGVKPIIFVLNNGGYTTERLLHAEGAQRKYPDLANWDYAGLLKVLGDFDGTASRSYKARTRKELSDLLDNQEFGEAKFITLVEIFMDKMDSPRSLKNWPKPGNQPERPL
ncbi:thiamine diphosphate-binding protein [Gymnopilus junonius]|uniref:Thiamine diphosphate-binding protein n=1 Tax=Gymnopilus junonius TaxID=109634 RepID=A0A9P5NM17_GYMJU|nr:thiamine diphosphate-binding protein [Gymnopilus junonius]